MMCNDLQIPGDNEKALYFSRVIRVESYGLFSQALRLLLYKADIRQEMLDIEAKAYRDDLIARGHLDEKDTTGDLGQSAVSRVLSGKRYRPTLAQVFIWLRVIRSHYDFGQDLEDDMFLLAGYPPPRWIVEAYERQLPLAQEPVPMRLSRKHKDTV